MRRLSDTPPPAEGATPLIFLDIDGVLNTSGHLASLGGGGCRDSKGRHMFDPAAVAALNAITDHTGAEIVITSTWRLFMSQGALSDMFEERGVSANVVGVTPEIPDAPRGWEIKVWAEQERPWDFGRYLIVDDDNDMMVEQRKNFIRTDHHDGITAGHVAKALRILTGKYNVKKSAYT